MKNLMKTRLLAVVMTVLAVYAAFIPQSNANPNLTNSLVAYWPMDATNGGILTPDMSGHGYDLQPWKNPGSVISQFTNDTAVLVPGIRAGGIFLTNTTLLAYNAGPNDLLAINKKATNYTVSFWFKYTAGTVAQNGGRRLWAEGNQVNNDPFFDLETIAGSAQFGTLSRQTAANFPGTKFSQMGGGGTANTPTNAGVVALDGNWHNITLIQQLITNTIPPVIVATNIAPDSNGVVTLTWSSIVLDDNGTNWWWQVDTNSAQQYVVQASTNLANPAAWVDVRTVRSAAIFRAGGTNFPEVTTATITNANQAARFYRILQPRVKFEKQTIIVDGSNFDGSMPHYRPFVNTGGLGFSSPSFGQEEVWNLDATAFGGLRRNLPGANGNAQFIEGAIYDDAAIWNRVLTQAEIIDFINDGITNAPGGSPLTVTLTPEFGAVVTNDTVGLEWKASANSTGISITPQVGNVFPISIQGQGSTNGPGTTISSNTTFQIVATRSTLTVTNTATINAVSNVNAGWHYIDDFTYTPNGGLNQVAGWVNPASGISTAGAIAAFVARTAGSGNKYASFDGDTNIGGFAYKLLKSWSQTLNQSNTLFFRFYINPADEGNTPDIDIHVGIMERGGLGLRDVTDFNTDDNIGPSIRIFRSNNQLGGPIDLVAANGPASMALAPDGYSYVADSHPAGLVPGRVYAVWMDVQNLTNTVLSGVETAGDLYDVWLQDETIAGPRTKIISGFTSSRDVANADALETINELFLNMNYAAPARPAASGYFPVNPIIQATNKVRFDDFYISKNGSGVGGGNDGVHSDKPVNTVPSFTP